MEEKLKVEVRYKCWCAICDWVDYTINIGMCPVCHSRNLIFDPNDFKNDENNN